MVYSHLVHVETSLGEEVKVLTLEKRILAIGRVWELRVVVAWRSHDV